MVFTKASSSAGCCWCVSSARSESFLPLRAAGERDALPGLGPVSRSLALSLPFQKNGNQTPEFIRGLQFCRWYRSSSADLRQRQNRPSYLFTQISAAPGARFVPLVPQCKSLCSLKLRPLDLFSYCSSRKCIPHTKARSFSLFFAQTCHKITFARREHPC